MEEINKRFGIIEAAIDLPDYEVIDLQIAHLRNLSTDKDLHSILYDLESKNFRQALYDMHNYSTTVKDDFFDGSSSDDAIADDKTTSLAPSPETNLFSTAFESKREEQIVSVDDMLRMTKESAASPREYSVDDHATIEEPAGAIDEEVFEHIDDPLFALDQYMESDDELSSQTVNTEGSILEKETEYTKEEVEQAPYGDAPLFTEEALFDDESPLYTTTETESEPEPELKIQAGETFSMDPFGEELHGSSEEGDIALNDERESLHAGMAATAIAAATAFENGKSSSAEILSGDNDTTVDDTISTPTPMSTTKRAWDFEPDEDDKLYKQFAYMDQKFRNMLHQHPQIEELEDGVCQEANDFIRFVSTNDYAESQVEAAIKRYQELKEEGKRAEAAQMLIASATTESTFAQFMLARELFKGEVLEQNYPESFTQINRLAEEDCPEAICDLGQLYEYGIGIDKNKQHALLLYEEAAEMGVERAHKHYERLKSASPIGSLKSITSSLWGRKRR